MKRNKIAYSAAALALTLLTSGCEEQIMEWKPGDPTVEISEIPLQLQEQIMLYKPIKDYVAQYHPHLNLAIGIGADMYLSDPDYKAVVDENFTGITLGNAMKMGVLMKSNGTLDFTTVDKVLASLPQGMKFYGHNLLWHTQQQQAYLKSLIAPQMVLPPSGDSGIANIITNSDFENGTRTGWTGDGGHYTMTVVSPGHDSNYAAKLECDDQTSANYDCQLWWDFNLEEGKTYAYRFWAKSPDNIQVQFLGQNSSTYDGVYCDVFTVGNDWTLCEGSFVYEQSKDVNRIGIQFGNYKNAVLYIDDFEFGEKTEAPAGLCPNGDFSKGMEGWTAQNEGAGVSVIDMDGTPSGNNKVMKLISSADSKEAYDLQVLSPDMPTMPGSKVEISFFVKSEGTGKGRLTFKGMTNEWPWINWTGNQSSWAEAFETSAEWTQIKFVMQDYSFDFTEGESMWHFNLEFGYIPDMTYYIDNIVVTDVTEQSAAKTASRAGVSRASGITFIPKSAEEKKAILLDAMETWIKDVMTHMGDRVDAWDVINEPIADGYNKWRGIDNIFGSSANDGTPDSAPVETEEGGLNLNWASDAGNQHWYWGYYLGKDYAVKAFEFARKHAPNPDVKLFVNDYNLETSPGKLAALIDFVNYIDNNGAHVDGIGTQMHVNIGITKEQVDAMFQTLAATGKLIRITELDIAFGVEDGKDITPSAEQLIQQSEAYKMILTSYLTNIPKEQQSSITLWSLSDNKKEHEYWLKGDAPNIFDKDYARKVAYKGVCDALAGFDIGAEFSGDAWKDLYQKEETEE